MYRRLRQGLSIICYPVMIYRMRLHDEREFCNSLVILFADTRRANHRLANIGNALSKSIAAFLRIDQQRDVNRDEDRLFDFGERIQSAIPESLWCSYHREGSRLHSSTRNLHRQFGVQRQLYVDIDRRESGYVITLVQIRSNTNLFKWTKLFK